MTSIPAVAGTLQTDPRSGGIKRSSDVNVLPSVAEAWAEVRDDNNLEVDWIILGYVENSKTDIAVLEKGNGGARACAAAVPTGLAVFGGLRQANGRFSTFFHADETTTPMQRGRASMHKNGVLNVLKGSDGEIDIKREQDVLRSHGDAPPVPISDARLDPTMQHASIGSRPVSESEPRSGKSAFPVTSAAAVVQSGAGSIPYEELKSITDASMLPEGVDLADREQALSNEEFVRVFGCAKKFFNDLPAWKRTRLKKENGLF